jgi:hypothetical protein
MNLAILVEGSETEPQVYRAWLRRLLPAMREVQAVADLSTDGYVLVKGMGIPSYVRRLAALLKDIDDHPGSVQALWICIDAEEATYEQRRRKVSDAIANGKVGTRLSITNPTLDIRILVQNCCIETWFLGHEAFARAGTQARAIVDYRRFYDVSERDPEQMPAKGGALRADFHLDYLQAMLAEHQQPYSKKNPGIVLDPSYFDALHKRCARTGHLPSFQALLDALRAAGAAV